MSEQLGVAVLELRTDQAPLNKGLDSAEARTKQSLGVMEGMVDQYAAAWARVGAAETAATDKGIEDADRLAAAWGRVGAAAHAAGDEMAAADAKGELGSVGRPGAAARGGSDRDIVDAFKDALSEMPDREAPGSATHVGGPSAGGMWGVRGPLHPGSLTNPVVMVLEAGKYAPMGSMAAALGDSNVPDEQGNQSPIASALDLQALSDQVAELSRRLSPSERLAQAGSEGIGTATLPVPGGPSAQVQDPESVLLLSQVVQALHELKDGVVNHSLITGAAQSAAPASNLDRLKQRYAGGQMGVEEFERQVDQELRRGTGTAGTYQDLLARQAAAEATAESARRGYAKTIRPGSSATPEEQAAALAEREAAVQQAAAARAETKAAEAQLLGSGHGGGGGGGHDDGILGWLAADAGGHHGGGASNLANLLKGEGGKGGHFGLPTFGSIGSLAGLGLEHWLLSGLGIAASATSAIGGAGLLGASGLTQGLIGGGADALVSKDTISQAQALNTNVQALDKAIAVYGAGSKQAAAAQYDLNQQWKELGGGAGKQAIETLDQNADAVKKLFDTTSAGAREQAADVDEQVLGLAKTYVPLITSAAERNLSIVNTGLRPLFQWLEGPQGIQIFDTLEDSFAKGLPTSIHALDMGIEDFLRLMAAASGDTGGLARDLDNLFTRKNQEDTAAYNAEVAKLVGDLHLWDALLKVLGEDLAGIFKADAGTAPAIVVSLTQMLDKLHEWETSTSGHDSLEDIFAVHKQEILQLLKLLPELGSGFGSFYLTVAPPLVKALTGIAHLLSDVLGFVDKLGPAARDMVGAMLVMSKLGVLMPVLRGIGGSLGLIETEEGGVGAAAAGGLGLGAAAAGGVGLSDAERIPMSAAPLLEAGAGGMALETAAVGSAGIGAAMSSAMSTAMPYAIAAAAAYFGSRAIAQALPHTTTTITPQGAQTSGGGPFGVNMGAGVVNIKDVGNYANYSTKQLQQLIDFERKANEAGFTFKVNGVPESLAAMIHLQQGAVTTKEKIVAAVSEVNTSLGHWYIDTGIGLGSLTDDFATHTRLIASLLGINSKAGEQAMSKNVADMVSAVQKGMLNGTISVSAGMASIKSTLTEGMDDNAITWSTKWGDMFTTLDELYAHNKISTATYMADTKSTMEGAFANIKTAVTSQYSSMFANLRAQEQKGVISHGEYVDQVALLNAHMLASEQADMTRFASNVLNAMVHTGKVSLSGADAIAKQLNELLGPLGATKIPVPTGVGVAIASSGGGVGGFYSGGKVSQPTYLVGEEGSANPEFVLATNPAYRVRNVGLWTEAGHHLGIPGFAQGGIAVGTGGTFSYSQLEGLWDEAASDMGHADLSSIANVMAAIALAESGGLASNYNPSGATGLWQILGLPFPGNPDVPLTNAEMAVAKYLSQGFGAWTTFTSGAYRQFLNGAGPSAVGLTEITAPQVKGSGLFADLVGAGLSKEAAAANAYLATMAPSVAGGGYGPGTVLATGGKPAQLEAAALEAAHQILGLPYTWGGGHQGFFGDPGFDCSGAVSYILHAMGLLGSPLTTSGLASWGLPGPGKFITVADSIVPDHTMISFFGHFLESGGHTSAGPHWDSGWSQAFPIFRHPPGLAEGGMVGDFGEVSPAVLLKGAPQLAMNPAFIAYAKAQGYKIPSGGASATGQAPIDSKTKKPIPSRFLVGKYGSQTGSTSNPVPSSGGASLNPKQPIPTPASGGGSDMDAIRSSIDHLNQLAGPISTNRTGVTWLTELLSYWPGAWSNLNPTASNIMGDPSAAIISTDADGNAIAPYVDYPDVNQAVAWLGQEITWESGIISDYQSVITLGAALQKAIAAAVAKRKAEVARIKAKIKANLKKVADLTKKINDLTKKIVALRAKNAPYSYPKTAAERAANKSFDTSRTQQIAAWNKDISGFESERGKVESENRKLGGNSLSVGSKGEIGPLNTQIGSLQTSLASVSNAGGQPFSRDAIEGVTGVGGALGPAQTQLQTFQLQLAALDPSALSTLLSAADSSSTSQVDSELVSLLQQQLQTSGEQLAVSQLQYGAVSEMPEFGGSFATGGTVPGPVGAARTVIAHGGEIITPPGQGTAVGDVHVHIDKRSDLNKLIDVRVQKSNRTTARRAGRMLPGAGGGQLTYGRSR